MNQSTAYVNADGSPRYGIRVEDLAAQAAPITPHAEPRLNATKKADRFHILQIAAASDLQHQLLAFSDDDKRIEALRESQPLALAKASATVREQLTSPAAWMKSASRQWTSTVVEFTATKREDVSNRALGKLILILLLSLLGPALTVGLLLQGQSLVTAIIVGLVVNVVTRAIIKPLAGRVPGLTARRPSKNQAENLWRHLENATLVDILRSEGVEVDQITAKAAARGWNHLQFVAHRFEALEEFNGAE